MSAVEEFHDACEDISEDKIVHFDITKYIIHRIDENKCLIKLTFKEFAMESVPWHYNRRINPEKVIELKEQLNVFDKETSPIWTVSLVFDKFKLSNSGIFRIAFLTTLAYLSPYRNPLMLIISSSFL